MSPSAAAMIRRISSSPLPWPARPLPCPLASNVSPVFVMPRLRASLDDFIRPRQHLGRDREAQSLRRLEIDHEPDLDWLLDGEVGGFGPLEDLVDVAGAAPPEIREVRPVGHEAPGFHGQPIGVCGGQTVFCREVYEARAVGTEHRVRDYEE